MKKSLLVFIVFGCFSTAAFSSAFYSCKSQYALCTTAACTPVAGKKDLVNCQCSVQKGYSVGAQQCQPVKKIAEGEEIYSRYFPIKSYFVCQNNRPWAWCLDKKCIINKNDPSTASCFCSTVTSKKPYVIVTDKAEANTCTTGIISSATVDDVNAVYDFIKTQKEPKQFPLKVLK